MDNTSKSNNSKITRLRLGIFIAIFLFCALTGFVVFQLVLPRIFQKNVNVASTPTQTIYINQGNLLVVHVDSLTASEPKLVSVWAIFISKNSPPSLIAKSLYPNSAAPETNTKIEQAFSYSEKNGLSPEFNRAVQSYDWQWNAFMIVDGEGIKRLSGWINKNAELPISDATSDHQTILETEKALLSLTCQNLAKPDSERGEKPHWQTLIPDHLQTDLFFKDAAVNWDRITFSTPAPDCKVLGMP